MPKKSSDHKLQEDVFNCFSSAEIKELIDDAQCFYKLNSEIIFKSDPDFEQKLQAAAIALIKLAGWHTHLQHVARIQKCTDS